MNVNVSLNSVSVRRFRLILGITAAWLVLPATPPPALASCELAGFKLPTGPARRWSASVPVGSFSQVQMQTGRVTTALPVVGWSGRGPAVSLTLYHHMVSP